jgi:hypothetical protein
MKATIMHAAGLAVGLACLAVAQDAPPAPGRSRAGAGKIEILGSWNGRIADHGLIRRAPESGFILEAAGWAALWRAWRPGEAVAPVDFTTQMVLVFTADGPNSVGCEPRLDARGHVLAPAMSTLIGGPGFGYLLQCIPRKGVRAVNGHPLPGEAPLPPPPGRGRPPEPGASEPGAAGQDMSDPVAVFFGEAGVVSSDAVPPDAGALGVPPADAPAVREIEGVMPRPGIFEAASRNAPLVLRSADEAARHFDAANAAALARRVNYARQVVLVFAWRGSGQDRLDAAVAESYPEQVFFTFRPGRTRDLREHVRIFALRKNVAWRAR